MGGFVKYGPPTADSQTTNLSKCSFFNTRTKNIEPLPPPYSINRYCLSGHDDTILDFTKKDLIYLNELIATNRAPDTVHAEKNIIAPQQIQPNPTFCPRTTNGQQKTTFWPDVTDPNEMCQAGNVVAVATLTPKDGKIVYRVGNRVEEKKIDIKKKNGYYGGELQIDNELQSILSNSKVKISSNNAIDSNNTLLLYNTDHTYSLGCPDIPNRPVTWHCGDG